MRPIPVLQIINLLLGIIALAWEWPLSYLSTSSLHRSIEARLVIYPVSSLAALLLYQGTNPAIYYLVGMGVYFWAFSEGEVSGGIHSEAGTMDHVTKGRRADNELGLGRVPGSLGPPAEESIGQSLTQRAGFGRGRRIIHHQHSVWPAFVFFFSSNSPPPRPFPFFLVHTGPTRTSISTSCIKKKSNPIQPPIFPVSPQPYNPSSPPRPLPPHILIINSH